MCQGGVYTCIGNIGGNKMLAPTEIIIVNKIVALTKILRQQKSHADKNLALTKILHQQKPCINKMLAQTQMNPLTVWHGRVHSFWLLPDLIEDLLRLPDGVDPFACSRQVWRCHWPPCFYGRTLSGTLRAYRTGPPCRKRHKFWRRQNISVCLKLLIFAKLHQSIYLLAGVLSKSGGNKKWSPSLSNNSLYTHNLENRGLHRDPRWGLYAL